MATGVCRRRVGRRHACAMHEKPSNCPPPPPAARKDGRRGMHASHWPSCLLCVCEELRRNELGWLPCREDGMSFYILPSGK